MFVPALCPKGQGRLFISRGNGDALAHRRLKRFFGKAMLEKTRSARHKEPASRHK